MKLEDMMKKISTTRFKKITQKQPTPTIADYLSDPNASRPYSKDLPKIKSATIKN